MISMSVFGTRVRVKTIVLANIAILCGGITWLGLYWHPDRGFWPGLLIGFLSAILLLIADFGHALAHIFSARYAGAPMDEILISADMPRTIYWNNQVSPNVHRMRALGGPIFNMLGLVLSLAIFGIASSNSIFKELAGWSVVGHGLLLIMSLLPISIVDGGTILKWTLVERGKTEIQADEMIRRINWGIGIVGIIIGFGIIAMRMWIAGLILVVISLVVLALAAGKIR